MNDPERTKRVGRPLDRESAQLRANQAAVLSDSMNLRILSEIAAGGSISSFGAQHLLSSTEIEGALDALTSASLLHVESSGLLELTADAWVRFGRLLTSDEPGSPTGQQVSLAALPATVTTVINDLAYRFHTTFNMETVTRYVVESYLLLSQRARVRTHLMPLTARYAADRLEALATVRGLRLQSSPEVLFVCVYNAGRSQMAGAFMRHFAGDRVHVRTAGSTPSAEPHPRVVAAMKEIDISVWGDFPKPLTDEVVRAADYVITMGCGDACPVFPGRRYLEWELDDPLTLDDTGLRRVRDEIQGRVLLLLREMGQADK